MNKESNKYIFGFASIMVIIVAAVLALAAILLKPKQDENIRIDKMVGILKAANIEQADASNAESLFKKYVTAELVLNKEGDIVSEIRNGKFVKGKETAFDVDLKTELKKKSDGEDFHFPLYEMDLNGKMIYVLPVLGKGLWGPIWGNIALGEDLNHVVGATFDHEKETPGLGAQIADRPFQEEFIGKVIIQDGKFVSIEAIKGGIATLPTEAAKEHGVDAISGGTLTSNGLTAMLQNCLENYVPFIMKKNPSLFKK
ncbi:MAG: NADH:ubiquinone reductase (Na(+)-transporting) subunit C [Hyphomicrobiales bacterium]